MKRRTVSLVLLATCCLLMSATDGQAAAKDRTRKAVTRDKTRKAPAKPRRRKRGTPAAPTSRGASPARSF